LKNMNRASPIILDGGMGQELYRRGIKKDNGLWSANALISHPDIVRDIHIDFIKSGAQIITTNSYCTNPFRLERENMGDQFDSLNETACDLARQAREQSGRKDVRIAGCLPPLYASFRPEVTHPFEEMCDEYMRMAEKLAPHVDLFLAETMNTPQEARAAAMAANQSGLECWVSWTLADDGSGALRNGDSLGAAYNFISDLNIDAVLVNCCPPESASAGLQILKDLDIADNVLLGAYANGFMPIPDQWEIDIDKLGVRDDLNPARYLDYVKKWLDIGADIVGGCCEIGPAHIEAIKDYLLQNNADQNAAKTEKIA